MIERLTNHYSFTNPATVHDEEALTALELAGRIGSKVNELVDDHNKNVKETNERLTAQDEKITHIQNVTVPREVEAEILSRIEDGTFDDAINVYMGDLEHRLNNIIRDNTGESVEIVDMRLDADGLANETAGEGLRNYQRKTDAKLNKLTDGVYDIGLSYKFEINRYRSNVFAMPESGLSVRVITPHTANINGFDCSLMTQVYLGTLVGGKFVRNEEWETEYSGIYTARIYYVPYVEGMYAQVVYTMVANGESQLNAENAVPFSDAAENIRAYAGKVKKAGGLISATPVSVVSHANETYTIVHGMRSIGAKYMAMATVLPLKFVHRVICSPHYWLSAKIYKFDQTTRKTTFIETLNHHPNTPCRGTECVLDFKEYGVNYYAVIVFGRVPLLREYAATGYGDYTDCVDNNTLLGFDLSGHMNNISVEWTTTDILRKQFEGGHGIVQQNIELLKSLNHKTASGLYARENGNKMHFIPNMNSFNGIFYGGDFKGGTVFYNVSPKAYFTALLNPNSVAYGETNREESGYNYGVVCSTFASLLHGHKIPASTFNLRYVPNTYGFDLSELNLLTDLHKLNQYDVLVWGNGHTGHSTVLNDVMRAGDSYVALDIIDADTPCIGHSIYPIHNGAPFVYAEPETKFVENYRFLAKPKPECEEPLYNRADWSVPYTEPQKVMCSRGYHSIYLKDVGRVIVSVDISVESITCIHEDGTIRNVPTEGNNQLNGYFLIDITSSVNKAGKWQIKNNVDGGVEEFFVVERPAQGLTIVDNGDTLTITPPEGTEPLYCAVGYQFTTGDFARDIPTAIYPPNEDGSFVVPTVIDTSIGKTEFSGRYGDKNCIAVVFKTEHDTNTFTINEDNEAYV